MGLEQIKVELVSHWGGDRNTAEAAWASSTDQEKLASKSDDDVRRVVSNVVTLHHDTPKERIWMEFFITCPIFVERQFDKYRMTVQYQDFQVDFLEAPFGRDGITQNELSGRYRTIPERPYKLPKDVEHILRTGDCADYIREYQEILEEEHCFYQNALNDLKIAQEDGNITNTEYKRAREVLRGVLGTSYLTDMRIVMNMNAFEHIINQRLAKDAQLDSRQVAAEMLHCVREAKVAPVMVEKMAEINGWNELLKDLKG